MRILFALAVICACAGAQENAAAPITLAAPINVATQIVVDVAPLAAPDLLSPYASPRDAARHRLQTTMADLQSKRDVRAAVRGFADAFATDSTYSIAVFDFGVVAAISERWEDAIAAFEEATRLDAVGVGPQIRPQLERLRLLAKLEATPQGKMARQYDEALLPLLAKLPKMPLAESMTAIASVGRVDPKRWEAPALLASLLGNGRNYDDAAKYLEIAAGNASDPAIRTALQKALKAAEREKLYASARAAAEAAADSGDHVKAAQMFEAAWIVIPARSGNGLNAASEVLLTDNTQRAATLLARLQACGDAKLTDIATHMLKELETIEPAAKVPNGDGSEFFRDAGTPEPVHISTLVPAIDRTQMELLARPLPKLISDPEAVVMLASLSVENPEVSGAALPTLSEPAISFENAWKDVLKARQKLAQPLPPALESTERATADVSQRPKLARLLKVTTEPAGASILLDDRAEEICKTPCDIRVEPGSHTVRFTKPGYKDDERTVTASVKPTEVAVPLLVARGFVLVEAPGPLPVKVNGSAVNATTPAELALVPGLYRIGAGSGSTTFERMLTVRSGARMRLQFKP